MRIDRERVVGAGLWALAALLGLRLVLFSASVATRPSDGFAAYHTSSRLVLEGAGASRFYDDGWFEARIQERLPAVRDIYNVNPPTTALLVLPLGGLDYPAARTAWTAFSLLCLLGATFWLLWETGIRGNWMAGFAVLVLAFQPVYANLNQGQAYLALLALLVAAWQGYRRDLPALLGIALGLMLVLKTAGALLWLLLLVRQQWRALGWAAGTVVIIALASLPLLGLEAWPTYLALVPGLASQPDMAVTAYQTQLSLLRHLLTFDPQWNPFPLVQAPALAGGLMLLSSAAILVTSLYLARGKDGDGILFGAFVAANLILSPVSLDYHYSLLLLPIALLAGWARKRSSPWFWGLLVVSAALIAVDLPYRSTRFQEGVWALLAYPKLYGAWLLWGASLWAVRRGGLGSRLVAETGAVAVQEDKKEERARNPGDQPGGYRADGAVEG